MCQPPENIPVRDSISKPNIYPSVIIITISASTEFLNGDSLISRTILIDSKIFIAIRITNNQLNSKIIIVN